MQLTRTQTTENRRARRARARRAACATVAAPVLAAAMLAQAPSSAAASVVPAKASTVLTLEPLNYGLFESTPLALQGSLCTAPNNCIHVKRPNSIDPTQGIGLFHEYGALAQGAAALDKSLASAGTDPTLVVGVSQGSQVAAHWLTNYAPDSDVDRSAVSFLLMADPANTYGVPWAPKVPTNSGFDVTEMWLQYDGWADWPQRFNPLAIANAIYGLLFVHPSGMIGTDPEDPSIIEWSTNGINYKMVPASRLPILNPLRLVGLGWLADQLNDPLTAIVEQGYTRPSTQEQADAMFGAPDAEETPATPIAAAVEDAVPVTEEPGSDIDDAEPLVDEGQTETGGADSDLEPDADEVGEKTPVDEVDPDVDEVERADEVEQDGAPEAAEPQQDEQGGPDSDTGSDDATGDSDTGDSADSPSAD